MNWADWTGRAVCMVITFGVAYLQTWAYTPENNFYSAVLQSILSALTNTCALLSAAYFVRGKASFDLQRLAYCALVVNLLNLIAFAAKSSPFVSVFNTVITVISYAQFIRILWPTNGSILDLRWRGPVHGRADLSGEGLHMEKKK